MDSFLLCSKAAVFKGFRFQICKGFMDKTAFHAELVRQCPDRQERVVLVSINDLRQVNRWNRLSAESLTLSPGIVEPGLYPFTDKLPFKFRHSADNMEHQAPLCCRKVEIILVRYKAHVQ